jgi:hypothetical protein
MFVVATFILGTGITSCTALATDSGALATAVVDGALAAAAVVADGALAAAARLTGGAAVAGLGTAAVGLGAAATELEVLLLAGSWWTSPNFWIFSSHQTSHCFSPLSSKTEWNLQYGCSYRTLRTGNRVRFTSKLKQFITCSEKIYSVSFKGKRNRSLLWTSLIKYERHCKESVFGDTLEEGLKINVQF